MFFKFPSLIHKANAKFIRLIKGLIKLKNGIMIYKNKLYFFIIIILMKIKGV